MKSADKKNNFSDTFEKSTPKNAINIIASRYLPFWWVFLISITLSLVLSFFYLEEQAPVYQADAMILIKDQLGGSGSTGSLESLLIPGSGKNVTNEVEVLKSRSLIQQVVKDIGLYAQVYQKGTFHDVMIYPSPVKFIALNPDILQNSQKIPISLKYIFSGNYIVIDGKRYPVNVPVVTPYGEFKIQTFKDNYKSYSGIEQFYLQIRDVKSAALNLSASLGVFSTSQQSSLVTLTVSDEVPFRAEEILNSIIRTYNKEGIDDKNATVSSTLDFINNRLVSVAKDLSSVEDNLQNFRTKDGNLDVSDVGKTFLGKVENEDETIAGIQIQLDVLDQVEKYIIKKGNRPGTVPSTLGFSDPLLNELLDRLYTTELDLNRQRQVSGENSPPIIALQAQIEQIRSSLLENINTQRQNLIITKNAIQAKMNKYSSLLKGVPQKERNQLEITRQQAIRNTIYTFLLQKKEETALSYASAVADTRVINYAESHSVPIKPIPGNIYMIGLLFGFVAAILFVLIKEQFNWEVLFRSDIENATDAPILAEIMHETSGDVLVIKEDKRTVIAEQLRSLRTSLNYIGIQGENKSILVTSSISGEGKSFMGLNLAVSLALTGKQVVLLEFDLRKPKISKMMDIKQIPGISNYLAGLATYEEIIVPMKDKNIPDLFILPAGNIPPNPTELMLNGRLDVLMEKLKHDFDYILIDSPPVGLVTDAKILNKYAGACLYMVRHKYTPKSYINLIQQLYETNEISNLNIIFNGVKSRGALSKYGGYGSNYGGGHGYGYGYTQDSVYNKQTLKDRINGLLKKKS